MQYASNMPAASPMTHIVGRSRISPQEKLHMLEAFPAIIKLSTLSLKIVFSGIYTGFSLYLFAITWSKLFLRSLSPQYTGKNRLTKTDIQIIIILLRCVITPERKIRMKKALKIILIILLCIFVIVGGYVAYVFMAYHRVGDMPLKVANGGNKAIETGKEYKIVSYNIGFGAYESDFGFFMDGGDRAWAWSKSRLNDNLIKIGSFLLNEKCDICLVQEVDVDSTRSYHIDERKYLTDVFSGKSYTFAENWDSPFLFYPLTQPHGAAKSGIMTFSSFGMTSAERVELPVEKGPIKIVDLDRCYSKHRIPADNGAELVLYNFHLSAYTSDGTIATDQLKLLLEDMKKEYEAGNYCVAGGDCNKDLLGNSDDYFGKADKEYSWAQPIPEGTFDGYPVLLVAPLDENNPVPSCRNSDSAYHEGQYVLTVDGFMATDNVRVESSKVIDTGFAYSDHNPVTMSFVLVK